MADNLTIFGTTYNDVIGIKVLDSNNNEITFVTPDSLWTDITLADTQSDWKRLTIGQANSGDLIGTTGNRYESSTTRISTKPPIAVQGAYKLTVTIAPNYKFCIYWFDSELTQRIDTTGWVTESTTYTVPDNTGNLVFSIALISNGTITLDDYNKGSFVCTCNTQSVMNTLSENMAILLGE